MSDVDDAIVRAERDRYGGFDQSGFLAQCIKDRQALAAEVKRLRALLREAADDIEAWGSYAGDYFAEKHDLAGDARKYREAGRD